MYGGGGPPEGVERERNIRNELLSKTDRYI
jgi:hypothetical protein